MRWLVRHLVTIITFFLTLAFASKLLRERRSPGSALAWLFTIVLVPYVGIPLYLWFGRRKLSPSRKQKQMIYQKGRFDRTPANAGTVERLLLASGAPPRREHNSIEIVADGTDAYERLLGLIDGAQRSIEIMTFILGKDEVARAVLERLGARAKAGVKVKFLLDGFGATMTNHALLKDLAATGAEVATFMPLFHFPPRGRSNLRNHRKITVIDDEVAMAGGMNLACEYLGPAPERARRLTRWPARWSDLALLIRGPIVSDLHGIFASDWKFATGREVATGVAAAPESARSGAAVAQVVASGPDGANDSIYDGLISAIFEAKSRIWIATPYFIPDETLTRALVLACRRGVDVRVLMPQRSNHRLADIGRGSYTRQIQEEGARILLHPKMVHAKATLIDDSVAIVGSANTDMRSFFFNYECCVFVYSEAELRELESWYLELARKCVVGYPAAAPGMATLEGMSRILSPLL